MADSLDDDFAAINKAITTAPRSKASAVPTAATPGDSRFAGVTGTGAAQISEPSQPSLLDRLWTDDFSAIPGIGSGAAAAARTYQQATDRISQAASFTEAKLPGGMDQMTWDQADNVSFGQAFVANAAAWAWDGVNFTGREAKGRAVGAPEYAQPDFDVTDKTQRKLAFEDDFVGKALSGAADMTFSWFLDPLVIAGKGAKVARFGSEVLGTRGPVSSSTNLPKVVAGVGWEADDALKHIATGGAEGSWNATAEAGRHIARSDYAELRNWAPVKQSPYADQIATVFANIKDERLGVMAYAASTGNERYLGLLRSEAQSVSDGLENFSRSMTYEKAFLAGVYGRTDTGFIDDVLERQYSAQTILDDLTTRDAALQDAITFYDNTSSPLTRIGSTSPGFERVRNVWSAAKSQRDLAKGERVGLDDASRFSDEAIPGGIDQLSAAGHGSGLLDAVKAGIEATRTPVAGFDPSIVEHVFQLSSSFRKVRLWAWASGQRSAGYADIRSFNDGHTSDEINAMLGDSRSLRKDGAFKQSMQDIWGQASTTDEKWAAIERIERSSVSKIAEAHGVDDTLLQAQYDWIAKRRNALINRAQDRKGRAFGVDDQGDLIFMHPQMVTQLESRVPLLDMRLMDQTARRLATDPVYSKAHDAIRNALLVDVGKKTVDEVQHIGESFPETATRWMDEINSVWKAAVLMRLGYTQRNVAEGWLRSWATLGSVPALYPAVVARGAKNVYWNAGLPAKLNTVDKVQTRIGSWIDEQRAVIKQIDEDIAKAGDQGPEWTAGLSAERKTAEQAITDYRNMSKDWDSYRGTLGKRYIGDDAAFMGPLGDVYRANASNAQTVQNFFESRADRDLLSRMSEQTWAKIEPGAKQYYSELANSVKQFSADPMAGQLVNGKSVDDVLAWARSADASKWAKELGLDSIAEREAHVNKISEMFDRYFPNADSRALIKDNPNPTGAQLKNVLPDESRLSAIHGREVKSALEAGGKGSLRKNLLEPIFKILGSMPESALVRQPFYNEVWKRETAALTAKAEAQGLNYADEAVARRINDAAHRRALAATNQTLFTITRYSNPAAALRFLSPFFAAWENSMRTWGRIIVNDPSVLARASMLWNVPATMGMVIDTTTGEKIKATPFSFVNTPMNAAIILPGALGEAFSAAAGGMNSVVPWGSLNVVSPGESPFLPGFNAPLISVPVGNVLAQRPDWQQWLQDHIGTTAYNQVVPFGVAEGGVGGFINQSVPSFARKAIALARGEDSDEYMKVLAAMSQSAYIDDQLGVEKFDGAKVKARTDQFYLFSIFSSLSLPVSLMRTSKYQVQLDMWHSISADPTLTFTQKLDLFRSKVGDAYMGLTRSTTDSKAPNLDPTMEAWHAIADNPDAVNRVVDRYGPEAAGVIAATAPDGQFSPGAYNYWLTQSMPGTDGNWKSKMDPEQIAMSSRVGEMWADYSKAKVAKDDELAKLGVKSITAKAAVDSGLKAQWDGFKQQMQGYYGDAWTAFGPDNYAPKMGKNLATINSLLADKKFMSSDLGKSRTWKLIAEYMSVRKDAVDALANGVKKQYVTDQWDEWRYGRRDLDVKFADFFDQYLDTDDLTAKVAG